MTQPSADRRSEIPIRAALRAPQGDGEALIEPPIATIAQLWAIGSLNEFDQ